MLTLAAVVAVGAAQAVPLTLPEPVTDSSDPASSEVSRSWQPGPALAGGVIGASVGGFVPATLGVALESGALLAVFPATLLLGAVGGTHLFSRARWGWELAGAATGAATSGIVVGAVLGTGPTRDSDVLLAGAGVALCTGLGAWTAAGLDSGRESLSVAPLFDGTGVAGVRLSLQR